MKVKQAKPHHLVGLLNGTGTVRFILTVDLVTKTYSSSVLKPGVFMAEVMPKIPKVSIHFEIFDSMDDVQVAISQLAKGFKEAEVDHVHCNKGGVDHTHQVNKLGLKVGACPQGTPRKSKHW